MTLDESSRYVLLVIFSQYLSLNKGSYQFCRSETMVRLVCVERERADVIQLILPLSVDSWDFFKVYDIGALW